MTRSEPLSRSSERIDHRLRPVVRSQDHAEPRTIVIRHGGRWQSLAVFLLSLLLMAVVLLGHHVVRGLDDQNRRISAAVAGMERKVQHLEAGVGFDSRRRLLLLGMRDQILKTNPKVSLADAYRYAELALDASERFPAVDPLLLLAIGVVESGYEAQARSPADARGLYQIWPSTGRMLTRALGWSYDDDALYDPEKNTLAAALYLDILFATYRDPRLVLAEYNGGPLNAGYYRASSGALAAETRSYVPRVLELYDRLREEFETGIELRDGAPDADRDRDGKTLGSGETAGGNARAGAP